MTKIKTGTIWPHQVDKSDLEISTYKGSGPGGQAKNKTSSGVRIKHIPTGLTTKCDEHREQSKNKAEAFKKLAEQLIPLMKLEVKKERYLAGIERVRTYHKPDNRVIDDRLPNRFDYYDTLEGDLDPIFDKLINAKIAR